TVIGTTGADGIATATLTNTTAGVSTVTATLGNGASQSVDTTFGPGTGPVATNVAIDNSRPFEGETLTGSYEFGDVDGDVEGASTFKWYRDGVEITGATAITYTLVAADRGKSIKFEVTPVSATGTPMGEPAQSAASLVAGCARRLETVGSQSYTCPLTKAEADADGISYSSAGAVAGVVFVRHDIRSATNYCNNLGEGYRLATKDELLALYATYGDMGRYAGWPSSEQHWSSTEVSLGRYYAVRLSNGLPGIADDSVPYPVTCVR
ncbi:adhesion domain-containing protein, partial [Aeromonas veronii]